MGLIDSATLLGIADRAGYQYGLLVAPFEVINVTGGGFYWQRVTATDDPDVEIPLLNTYYTTDTTGFDLETTVKSGLPKLLSIVTAMDAHFGRVTYTGGWDGFLTSNDERVSDYFNQLYYGAKTTYMLANNVFSETEDTFGTWQYGDTFTDGIDYGDGSPTNRASGTNFAATQLKAIVDTGSTSCTSLILRLSVKDEDNVPTTIDTPAITGGVGTEVDIGTSADRFLDVTNIVKVSGDLSGNIVRIENKKERQVAP